jgi:ribonuclease P protein component
MAAPPPTLKHRRDFLACARARRWAAPGLVLQARRRPEHEAGAGARADGGSDAGGIRVGYTC